MIFLVLLTAVILPEVTRSADVDDPMVTMKTVLKSWHMMYNTYREEIKLGYCWADYFLDVKKLLGTLTGSRILGYDPDDPSPLFSVIRNWVDPSLEKSDVETSTEGYQDYQNDDVESYDDDEYPQRYIYPGSYEGGRSLKVFEDESRGLSDFFVSLLGLNVPPGSGPLILGSRGPGPLVIIFSKVFGTVLKIGRNVLDTIETTSILSCTKDYVLVKVFRWIDS